MVWGKRLKVIAAVSLPMVGGLLIYLNWPTRETLDQAVRRGNALHAASHTMPPSTARTPEERAAEMAARMREQHEAYLRQEEQELSTVLSSNRRTMSLPGFVRRVYVDSTGKAWFVGVSVGENEESFRRRVENAYAGKSRIIRGALWLIDRRHRFWVAFDDVRPKSILCYDGKQWKQHDLPALPPNNTFELCPHAWEDSEGKVWFVMLDRSAIISWVLCCDADGQWFQTKIPGESGFGPGVFWEDPELTESPRGVPAFYSARVYPSDVERGSCLPRVYRFSKTVCRGLLARVCWDHPTEYVLPLTDGRVLTICSDNRLFAYAAPSEQAVLKLMSDLDNPDPAARESAMSTLDQLGGEYLDLINKGIESATTPGAQMAITSIRDRMAKPPDKQRPLNEATHPQTMECDGFSFSHVRYVGTAPDGSHLLDVDDYRDATSPNVLRRALVTYHADGTRTMKPLPPDWPSDMFGHNTLRDDILVGRDGSIWFRDGRRYKDGVITQELSEWLGRMPKQDDNEGHLFCDKMMVVNTRVPVDEASLPKRQ